jgi:hypothetical protein
MDVKWSLSQWRIGGSGERKGYWGVKRIEYATCMYTYQSIYLSNIYHLSSINHLSSIYLSIYLSIYEYTIMIPIRHCLKKGEVEYNQKVNLFKVYCTHVWGFHIETPILLMYANSNIKLNFKESVFIMLTVYWNHHFEHFLMWIWSEYNINSCCTFPPCSFYSNFQEK